MLAERPWNTGEAILRISKIAEMVLLLIVTVLADIPLVIIAAPGWVWITTNLSLIGVSFIEGLRK